MSNQLPRGFLALTAVLMITFTLATIAVASAQITYAARFLIEAYEDRHRARINARSCVDAAIAIVREEPDYIPSTASLVWLSADTFCRIESIDRTSDRIVIRASAAVHKATARVEVEARSGSDGGYEILSQRQLGEF